MTTSPVGFVTVRDVRIPALGLGTAGLRNEVAKRIVRHALAIGYRHIDTAQAYRNEAAVGEAIRGSAVPRDEIWLTTKIGPAHFRDGDLQRAPDQSLSRLGSEPDLLLLHWPSPTIPLRETMGAFNDVKRRGLAKHIGVSNFTVALLQEALALTREPLLVNQVEYHPYLGQKSVLAATRAAGMTLIAYSPLARGRVFRDPHLRAIGERYGKSPGQVALRWLLQQDGVIAIPRSAREAHAQANLEVFDFELTPAEMAAVGAKASPAGRLIDPPWLAPDWDDLDGLRPWHRRARWAVRTLGTLVGRILS
jgi:diketogulonate reductase-like aldo/keto reductase